ncbi:hypothetical protein [Luteibaculum oceani]|uniref:Uncharacterized protein n=1 Tax=Luteibaculum oceani TaxID=1294296 RepID=A0A5C6V8C7_9FLAO|nr:hypothetical protein [Luteibaculum oceani]TXC81602.1 hypothetical protein FRX97_03520 [Luteibaculum oceani]
MRKQGKSLPVFHKEGLAQGVGFFIVVGGGNTILGYLDGRFETPLNCVLHILGWIFGGLIYAVAYNRWIVTFKKGG